MTELVDKLIEEKQGEVLVTHKNIRRYEANVGYVIIFIFGALTLMMLCGMTLTFAHTALNAGLASGENILGVRGDGEPPSFSIPEPPVLVEPPLIGITPIPTPEIAPTITVFGEIVIPTPPITDTGVITP